MLSNENLNSKEKLYNSNDKNLDKFENDNENINNTSLKSSKSISYKNESIRNLDNENTKNDIKTENSYNSENSNNSNVTNNNKDSTFNNISISHLQNINDNCIYENNIVNEVNNQIKSSIDHHPDYLSKYLFTNKSYIGTNKYDSIKEPKFPTKDETPIWKIDISLNEKSKVLIDILDHYEPISSIYTSEKLTLNEKDHFGYYSILIRESFYNDELCYYICTDIKIYDKNTSETIVDKVTVAYVSTSLYTLNQTTREYIGLCEDQNNIKHYILTKFRIINYKTDKQNFIYSIYDENYYNENSKIIIAPHILTEGGEEILSRIFGLILDEDSKDNLLNSTEFISLINDELKITKFTLKTTDKKYINGYEKEKIEEITEEIKYNNCLNRISKIHEIENMKKELEEMELESSWDTLNSYDYLDLPKKIIELKKVIDTKQEMLDNEIKNDSDIKNLKVFDINENGEKSNNVIHINNVNSIKKSYIPINREKYFINITQSEEDNQENIKKEDSLINQNENNLLINDEKNIFNQSNYVNNSKEFKSSNSSLNSLSSYKESIGDEDVIKKSKSSVKSNSINTLDGLNKHNSLSSNKFIEDNQIKLNNDNINNEDSNTLPELIEKSGIPSQKDISSLEKLKNSLTNIFNNSSVSLKSDKTSQDAIINNVSSSLENENNTNNKSSIESINYINSKSNNSITLESVTKNEISQSITENNDIIHNKSSISLNDVKNDKNSINNENNNNQNIEDNTTVITRTITTTETKNTSQNIETNESIKIINNKNNEILQTTETFQITQTITTTENVKTTENIKINEAKNESNEMDKINEAKNENNYFDKINETKNKGYEIDETKNDSNNIKTQIYKENNNIIMNNKSVSMDSLQNEIESIKQKLNEELQDPTLKPNDDDLNNIKNEMNSEINESKSNRIMSLKNELSEDPHISEVKRLFGMDIPQSILYPYIEYDYQHQEGYLRIYCSKWQVAFNNDIFSKKDKYVLKDEHLLDSPDAKSEYLTIKDKTKNQYTKYLKNNPHLKKLISDYLQLLLSKKPKDVYIFTKNYFNNNEL
ncbi:hypothetical protein BCR32DRAFT_289591 [Anaeromyces robustus]|uniref:RIIa domain-containing protein n=1 Tax=Anaeromyces robustus TaxID=1754192 RepID=A0A1Y1XP07_9FUNG|nr:hypothetical protein BCR32DRAFT_289591 [Anaeromyces robustus]|eukprot:ORX87054.1 hypothetical protein BCR32DRAFT_289591 [Anaeromyces robustus]